MVLKVWSLDQCVSITWEPVRHADSWAPPGPNSETLVVGNSNMVFQEPLVQLSIENHCSRSVLLKLSVYGDPVKAQALHEEVWGKA